MHHKDLSSMFFTQTGAVRDYFQGTTATTYLLCSTFAIFSVQPSSKSKFSNEDLTGLGKQQWCLGADHLLEAHEKDTYQELNTSDKLPGGSGVYCLPYESRLVGSTLSQRAHRPWKIPGVLRHLSSVCKYVQKCYLNLFLLLAIDLMNTINKCDNFLLF